MARACFETKRRDWAEKVCLQKESDPAVSIAAWCREHKIDYKAFLYWKKRLESNSPTTLDRSSFTELSEVSATAGITIEYRSVHIRLEKNFDSAVLVKCLQAIKEAVC